MIALDLQTFRQSHASNNVTGVIYVELESGPFPGIGWSDFPVIILSWWAEALLDLQTPTRRKVHWQFMDGPYSLALRKETEPIPIGALTFEQLESGLVEAAQRVVAYCEQHKMFSRFGHAARKCPTTQGEPGGAANGSQPLCSCGNSTISSGWPPSLAFVFDSKQKPMALIKCRDCGREISARADKCPNCGAPLKRRTSGCAMLVAVFAGLVLVGYIASLTNENSPTSRSPVQAPALPTDPTHDSEPQPVSAAAPPSNRTEDDHYARGIVIQALTMPNKLGVGGREFHTTPNPKGEGVFVYDPRTRFSGVQRNLIWLVIKDTAYALNGPSKMLTPSLEWPREADEALWKTTGLDPYMATEAINIVFGTK